MVAIDVALAFLHPLAVIILACVWTLLILRREYRPHLPDEQITPEDVPDDASAPEEIEGVQS